MLQFEFAPYVMTSLLEGY